MAGTSKNWSIFWRGLGLPLRPGMVDRARVVVLVALAGAFGPPSLSPADAAPLKAEVAATVANGFARLVFTLPEEAEAEAEVRLANGIVVVSFKQPVDLSIDHLAVATPGYIVVARRDPDGTAVRIALGRKVHVNATAAGERLFVDLLPDGWSGLPPGLPPDVVEDLARRAREAERKVRQQQQKLQPAPQRQPAIRVRASVLPTFSRYTFDLPQVTAVATERGKDKLSLVFDAPLKFDLADAKATLPPTVAAVEAETGETNATVRFMLVGKVDVRTFREDAAFIVDVGPTAAAELESPPPSPPLAEAAGPKVAQASPASVEAPLAPKTAKAEVPPVDTVPPPSALPAGTVGPASDALPAANAPVTALTKRQGDSLRLIFPFRAATSAAVFRRGDALWLIFDSDAPLDVRRFKDDPTRMIRDASVTRSGKGQVVRIKLDRSRLSSMAGDGDAWIVTVGETVLEATAPLAIARVNPSPTNVSAAIAFDDPRRVHQFVDPELGDTLLVVTGFAPARGFLKVQDFVEFRVLPSTHGVAIEPLADDLAVETVPERIVVGRPGGLIMTPTGGSQASAQAPASSRPAALDVQSWESDRQADFLQRQTALIAAAAEAPNTKRNAARVDVARFYLAREMVPEAKGALDAAIASERNEGDLAAALVLRGIVNLMLGREDQALNDLANPVVGAQHDAQLWRGIALSRQGRFPDARESFKNVEAATAGLPLELQRLAIKEAVRCAVEVGDFADAARRLNDFDGIGVPPPLKPALAVLSGRAAEGLGRLSDALGAYRMAAESNDGLSAAQARLRLTALRHTLKQIKREEAISEFEALAAGWRGDAVELEALRLLARLYIEEGRYRDAFRVVNIANGAHPHAEMTRRMQDEASAAFDSVFLGERGDKLAPVEALGLFYDFRTLTPPGRRGDEMIRRLAERLIAMDLLKQASELLQHQIENRLQGAARPQAAARLATVYLMDRKPDRALQALRATRMADLPNDLRQQRLLLEARALSDAGRHDLALEITERIVGREAERLRADTYWRAQRWRAAAEQIERLHGERWREPAPLDATDRTDILRAGIAYALAEDVIGLDRLRQKYAPKMADTPDRRMFDVVTAPFDRRSEEFAEIAKAASSVDTLGAFLRDLRARFPDPAGVVSSAS